MKNRIFWDTRFLEHFCDSDQHNNTNRRYSRFSADVFLNGRGRFGATSCSFPLAFCTRHRIFSDVFSFVSVPCVSTQNLFQPVSASSNRLRSWCCPSQMCQCKSITHFISDMDLRCFSKTLEAYGFDSSTVELGYNGLWYIGYYDPIGIGISWVNILKYHELYRISYIIGMKVPLRFRYIRVLLWVYYVLRVHSRLVLPAFANFVILNNLICRIWSGLIVNLISRLLMVHIAYQRLMSSNPPCVGEMIAQVWRSKHLVIPCTDALNTGHTVDYCMALLGNTVNSWLSVNIGTKR